MDFLESWYENNISGKDGKFKGRGIGAAILKPFVDEEKIEQRVQRTKNQLTAQGQGYSLSDLDVLPGASTIDVQGAAIRKTKQTRQEEKDKDYSRELEPIRMQMQQQMNLTQLQMADAKDARASELQYQKMRDRRADMEYNERMERLDRKDRQAMMQNLAAGLASLGAAFAL